MTIIWVDWVNGLDTNAGTNPALPKKTITSATTGRTGGDKIRVAKSPDPTPLTGTISLTNASLNVIGVGTLFTSELALGDFIEYRCRRKRQKRQSDPVHKTELSVKRITAIFLLAELLDCLTTLIGVGLMGMTELNPLSANWSLLIPLKMLGIGLVAGVLQWRGRGAYWIIPVIAGIPVLWNLLNIVVEVL